MQTRPGQVSFTNPLPSGSEAGNLYCIVYRPGRNVFGTLLLWQCVDLLQIFRSLFLDQVAGRERGRNGLGARPRQCLRDGLRLAQAQRGGHHLHLSHPSQVAFSTRSRFEKESERKDANDWKRPCLRLGSHTTLRTDDFLHNL